MTQEGCGESDLSARVAVKLGWVCGEVQFQGRAQPVWTRGEVNFFECPPYAKAMSWAFEAMEKERIGLVPMPNSKKWVALGLTGTAQAVSAPEAVCMAFLGEGATQTSSSFTEAVTGDVPC